MKSTLAPLAAAALVACSGGSGASPAYPNPGEPNDTLAQATQLAPEAPILATSSSEADYDFYAFAVPAGGATVRFQTFDETGATCNGVDTFVELYDPAGQRLTWSDDSWAGPDGRGSRCEDFTFALPEGTAHVAVSGYPPYPFVYTLVVSIP